MGFGRIDRRTENSRNDNFGRICEHSVYYCAHNKKLRRDLEKNDTTSENEPK